MKKIVYIIILWIYVLNIYGQSDASLKDVYKAQLPHILHPTPQTQLFEDYIRNHDQQEINSKGFQEITIPIYEVKIDGINIPISLSYQTRGIRFNQHNGDVGVGWVLSPGCRISRTVFGMPDERGYRVPEDILNEYLTSMEVSGSAMEKAENGDAYLASFFPNGAPVNTPSKITVYDKLDAGYDHFSYSTFTSNAHFLITNLQNKNTDILEKLNDQITFNLSNGTYPDLTDLAITDTKGFKYYYGKAQNGEYVYEQNVGIHGLKGRTAWPLMYIQSPHNKSVHFEYIADYVKYHDQMKISSYTIQDALLCFYNLGGAPRTQPYSTETQDYEVYSDNQIKTFLISKITSDNEVIEFIRDDNFPCSENSTRLTCINIYNKNNKLIKYVKFQYSTIRYPHYFLKSIEIGGEDGKEIQKYKFDYKGDSSSWGNDMLTALKRFTADQWGYYKEGATQSSTLHYVHSEFEDDRFFENPNAVNNFETAFPLFRGRATILQFALNRANNTDASMFSLTKVTYPTGGTVEYEYKPHKYLQKENVSFKIPEKIITGGGVRVESVSFYNKDVLSKVKKYTYGADGSGIGQTIMNITHKAFADESLQLSFHSIGDGIYAGATDVAGKIMRTYSNKPMGDINMAEHFTIDYPQVSVIEQELDNNKNVIKTNGRGVHTFIIQNQFTPTRISPRLQAMRTDLMSYGQTCRTSNTNRPLYINNYRYGNKPLLESKIYINNNGDTISYEKLSYKKTTPKQYNGIRLNQRIFTNWGTYDPEYRGEEYNVNSKKNINVNANYGSFYDYVIYKLYSEADLLESKTNTLYTSQGKIITKDTYSYDTNNRVIKVNQTNSLSGNLEKELIYPSSGALVTKNIIGVPVKRRTKHNNNWIGTVEDVFPSTAIQPSETRTSTSDGSNSRIDIIYQYYANGNIRQLTTLDGLNIVYLYSYNSQYPIAEIKNATLTEVTAVLSSVFGVSTADALSALTTPNEAKLKDGSLQKALPNALVTTYTYKPLVGILTMTDLSGITTYYDYDSFGRLKETYLMENGVKKVVQSYNYHYQNQ